MQTKLKWAQKVDKGNLSFTHDARVYIFALTKIIGGKGCDSDYAYIK